jgi:hypothetical protein
MTESPVLLRPFPFPFLFPFFILLISDSIPHFGCSYFLLSHFVAKLIRHSNSGRPELTTYARPIFSPENLDGWMWMDGRMDCMYACMYVCMYVSHIEVDRFFCIFHIRKENFSILAFYHRNAFPSVTLHGRRSVFP